MRLERMGPVSARFLAIVNVMGTDKPALYRRAYHCACSSIYTLSSFLPVRQSKYAFMRAIDPPGVARALLAQLWVCAFA